MSTKIIMPQLGETIVEGSISKWLKKEGDRIERDESLVEVTTDKVDMEIPSPAAGIIAQLLVAEGETVEVGQEIAIIEEGEAIATAEHETQPEVDVEEAASLAVETETEVAPKRVPAAPAPDVGIESVDKAAIQPPMHSAEIQEKATGYTATHRERGKRSSPLVRRIAKEHNIDIDQIIGTGIDGRVTKSDILAFIEEQKAVTPNIISTTAKSKDVVKESVQLKAEVQPGDEDEIILLTGMRKAIAEHMVISKQTIPHTTTIADVDMTSIVDLRQQNKQRFQRKHNVNLTFMPFIIQATAQALKEYPMMNSSLVEEKIIVKKRINIGVAVAVEKGLILPVIKNADEKSFVEVAIELDDLAKRARTGKLLPDEVQGGTFSITNPGVFGALLSVPIINHPQAAILGVEKIMKAPVVINDAIAIRSVMYLCMSYDHRIIDGATAIQFLQNIKRQLEECKFELS